MEESSTFAMKTEMKQNSNYLVIFPPFLRGLIHLTSFCIILLTIIILLILHIYKKRSFYAPLNIYLLSQMILFGISGFYHRYKFSQGVIYKKKIINNIEVFDKENRGFKAVLQKFDHSCIFILIAGTQTSVILSLYYGEENISKDIKTFIKLTWIYALLGILKVFLSDYLDALSLNNDLTNTFIYIIHGFLVLPFLKYFTSKMTKLGVVCLVLGGFVYSLGGILFSLEIPKLKNNIFRYHEFWHLMTVIANSCFGIPILLKYKDFWFSYQKASKN